MASRDAEEAKTRLLEKPGGPKAEEPHERKTTRLQVYKSTRLQVYKAANHKRQGQTRLLRSEEAERRTTMELRTYLSPREKATIRLLLGFRGDEAL